MFEFDPRSRKSIYEQVMDNLKDAIVMGQLPEGTKLPSVRELSKSISVNPNTVQKAYRELEQQGYIYTKTGLGTFVCPRSEIRAEGPELERAEEEMAEAFKTFLRLGLGFEESEKKALEIFEIIRKESDEK